MTLTFFALLSLLLLYKYMQFTVLVLVKYMNMKKNCYLGIYCIRCAG
jgi:hypothetical protein